MKDLRIRVQYGEGRLQKYIENGDQCRSLISVGDNIAMQMVFTFN